jgi:AbrB family looped-hinge helix DNA binding protein
MKAYTITPKGQVTIPSEIREKLKLQPGDKVTYQDTAAGILLKPAKKDMIDDFGFLKGRREPAELDTIRKAVRKKIADKGHRK